MRLLSFRDGVAAALGVEEAQVLLLDAANEGPSIVNIHFHLVDRADRAGLSPPSSQLLRALDDKVRLQAVAVGDGTYHAVDLITDAPPASPPAPPAAPPQLGGGGSEFEAERRVSLTLGRVNDDLVGAPNSLARLSFEGRVIHDLGAAFAPATATIIITSLTQAAAATMLTLRLRLPSGAEADPASASDLYEATANLAARAAVGQLTHIAGGMVEPDSIVDLSGRRLPLQTDPAHALVRLTMHSAALVEALRAPTVEGTPSAAADVAAQEAALYMMLVRVRSQLAEALGTPPSQLNIANQGVRLGEIGDAKTENLLVRLIWRLEEVPELIGGVTAQDLLSRPELNGTVDLAPLSGMVVAAQVELLEASVDILEGSSGANGEPPDPLALSPLDTTRAGVIGATLLHVTFEQLPDDTLGVAGTPTRYNFERELVGGVAYAIDVTAHRVSLVALAQRPARTVAVLQVTDLVNLDRDLDSVGCCQVSAQSDVCAYWEYDGGTCSKLNGKTIECSTAHWAADKAYDMRTGRCLVPEAHELPASWSAAHLSLAVASGEFSHIGGARVLSVSDASHRHAAGVLYVEAGQWLATANRLESLHAGIAKLCGVSAARVVLHSSTSHHDGGLHHENDPAGIGFAVHDDATAAAGFAPAADLAFEKGSNLIKFGGGADVTLGGVPVPRNKVTCYHHTENLDGESASEVLPPPPPPPPIEMVGGSLQLATAPVSAEVLGGEGSWQRAAFEAALVRLLRRPLGLELGDAILIHGPTLTRDASLFSLRTATTTVGGVPKSAASCVAAWAAHVASGNVAAVAGAVVGVDSLTDLDDTEAHADVPIGGALNVSEAVIGAVGSTARLAFAQAFQREAAALAGGISAERVRLRRLWVSHHDSRSAGTDIVSAVDAARGLKAATPTAVALLRIVDTRTSRLMGESAAAEAAVALDSSLRGSTPIANSTTNTSNATDSTGGASLALARLGLIPPLLSSVVATLTEWASPPGASPPPPLLSSRALRLTLADVPSDILGTPGSMARSRFETVALHDLSLALGVEESRLELTSVVGGDIQGDHHGPEPVTLLTFNVLSSEGTPSPPPNVNEFNALAAQAGSVDAFDAYDREKHADAGAEALARWGVSVLAGETMRVAGAPVGSSSLQPALELPSYGKSGFVQLEVRYIAPLLHTWVGLRNVVEAQAPEDKQGWGNALPLALAADGSEAKRYLVAGLHRQLAAALKVSRSRVLLREMRLQDGQPPLLVVSARVIDDSLVALGLEPNARAAVETLRDDMVNGDGDSRRAAFRGMEVQPVGSIRERTPPSPPRSPGAPPLVPRRFSSDVDGDDDGGTAVALQLTLPPVPADVIGAPGSEARRLFASRVGNELGAALNVSASRLRLLGVARSAARTLLTIAVAEPAARAPGSSTRATAALSRWSIVMATGEVRHIAGVAVASDGLQRMDTDVRESAACFEVTLRDLNATNLPAAEDESGEAIEPSPATWSKLLLRIVSELAIDMGVLADRVLVNGYERTDTRIHLRLCVTAEEDIAGAHYAIDSLLDGHQFTAPSPPPPAPLQRAGGPARRSLRRHLATEQTYVSMMSLSWLANSVEFAAATRPPSAPPAPLTPAELLSTSFELSIGRIADDVLGTADSSKRRAFEQRCQVQLWDALGLSELPNGMIAPELEVTRVAQGADATTLGFTLRLENGTAAYLRPLQVWAMNVAAGVVRSIGGGAIVGDSLRFVGEPMPNFITAEFTMRWWWDIRHTRTCSMYMPDPGALGPYGSDRRLSLLRAVHTDLSARMSLPNPSRLQVFDAKEECTPRCVTGNAELRRCGLVVSLRLLDPPEGETSTENSVWTGSGSVAVAQFADLASQWSAYAANGKRMCWDNNGCRGMWGSPKPLFVWLTVFAEPPAPPAPMMPPPSAPSIPLFFSNQMVDVTLTMATDGPEKIPAMDNLRLWANALSEEMVNAFGLSPLRIHTLRIRIEDDLTFTLVLQVVDWLATTDPPATAVVAGIVSQCSFVVHTAQNLLQTSHNNLPMIVLEEDTPPQCAISTPPPPSPLPPYSPGVGAVGFNGALGFKGDRHSAGGVSKAVKQTVRKLAQQMIQTSVAGEAMKRVESGSGNSGLAFRAGKVLEGKLASCFDVSLGPEFGTATYTQACLPTLFVDLARATRRRSLFERARADFHRRLTEGSSTDPALGATASAAEEQMGTAEYDVSIVLYATSPETRPAIMGNLTAPAPASMLMELTVQHSQEDDFTWAVDIGNETMDVLLPRKPVGAGPCTRDLDCRGHRLLRDPAGGSCSAETERCECPEPFAGTGCERIHVCAWFDEQADEWHRDGCTLEVTSTTNDTLVCNCHVAGTVGVMVLEEDMPPGHPLLGDDIINLLDIGDDSLLSVDVVIENWMIIALIVGIDAVWVVLVCMGKCRSNDSRIRKYVHHYEYWHHKHVERVRLIHTPWHRRLYGQIMVQHRLFRVFRKKFDVTVDPLMHHTATQKATILACIVLLKMLTAALCFGGDYRSTDQMLLSKLLVGVFAASVALPATVLLDQMFWRQQRLTNAAFQRPTKGNPEGLPESLLMARTCLHVTMNQTSCAKAFIAWCDMLTSMRATEIQTSLQKLRLGRLLDRNATIAAEVEEKNDKARALGERLGRPYMAAVRRTTRLVRPKSADKALQDEAAKWVQRVTRGKTARDAFKVRKEQHAALLAATFIQKLYRGKKARIKACEMREKQAKKKKGLMSRFFGGRGGAGAQRPSMSRSGDRPVSTSLFERTQHGPTGTPPPVPVSRIGTPLKPDKKGKKYRPASRSILASRGSSTGDARRPASSSARQPAVIGAPGGAQVCVRIPAPPEDSEASRPVFTPGTLEKRQFMAGLLAPLAERPVPGVRAATPGEGTNQKTMDRVRSCESLRPATADCTPESPPPRPPKDAAEHGEDLLAQAAAEVNAEQLKATEQRMKALAEKRRKERDEGGFDLGQALDLNSLRVAAAAEAAKKKDLLSTIKSAASSMAMGASQDIKISLQELQDTPIDQPLGMTMQTAANKFAAAGRQAERRGVPAGFKTNEEIRELAGIDAWLDKPKSKRAAPPPPAGAPKALAAKANSKSLPRRNSSLPPSKTDTSGFALNASKQAFIPMQSPIATADLQRREERHEQQREQRRDSSGFALDQPLSLEELMAQVKRGGPSNPPSPPNSPPHSPRASPPTLWPPTPPLSPPGSSTAAELSEQTASGMTLQQKVSALQTGLGLETGSNLMQTIKKAQETMDVKAEGGTIAAKVNHLLAELKKRDNPASPDNRPPSQRGKSLREARANLKEKTIERGMSDSGRLPAPKAPDASVSLSELTLESLRELTTSSNPEADSRRRTPKQQSSIDRLSRPTAATRARDAEMEQYRANNPMPSLESRLAVGKGEEMPTAPAMTWKSPMGEARVGSLRETTPSSLRERTPGSLREKMPGSLRAGSSRSPPPPTDPARGSAWTPKSSSLREQMKAAMAAVDQAADAASGALQENTLEETKKAQAATAAAEAEAAKAAIEAKAAVDVKAAAEAKTKAAIPPPILMPSSRDQSPLAAANFRPGLASPRSSPGLCANSSPSSEGGGLTSSPSTPNGMQRSLSTSLLRSACRKTPEAGSPPLRSRQASRSSLFDGSPMASRPGSAGSDSPGIDSPGTGSPSPTSARRSRSMPMSSPLALEPSTPILPPPADEESRLGSSSSPRGPRPGRLAALADIPAGTSGPRPGASSPSGLPPLQIPRQGVGTNLMSPRRAAAAAGDILSSARRRARGDSESSASESEDSIERTPRGSIVNRLRSFSFRKKKLTHTFQDVKRMSSGVAAFQDAKRLSPRSPRWGAAGAAAAAGQDASPPNPERASKAASAFAAALSPPMPPRRPPVSLPGALAQLKRQEAADDDDASSVSESFRSVSTAQTQREPSGRDQAGFALDKPLNLDINSLRAVAQAQLKMNDAQRAAQQKAKVASLNQVIQSTVKGRALDEALPEDMSIDELRKVAAHKAQHDKQMAAKQAAVTEAQRAKRAADKEAAEATRKLKQLPRRQKSLNMKGTSPAANDAEGVMVDISDADTAAAARGRLAHADVLLLGETFADMVAAEHAFLAWRRILLDERDAKAAEERDEYMLRLTGKRLTTPAAGASRDDAPSIVHGATTAMPTKREERMKLKRLLTRKPITMLTSRADLLLEPVLEKPERRQLIQWRKYKACTPWFYCVWDSVRFWRYFPWLFAVALIGVANFFTLWVGLAAFYGETERFEGWVQSVAISFGWAWLVQEPAVIFFRTVIIPHLIRSPSYLNCERYVSTACNRIVTQFF